ncbi:hypothetical protein K2173_008768 [Erythroxylum novogranatense]|uniref:Pre-rRNA-processing protein TSR2 homolog n=1 Tax=Erythroxylum novogranatense TaxID=1862640 RepID=A0AAV8S5J9_9ROSI|nr:hypothetical protein K2173_008768 [Erythroxylum novogranatense]
MDSITRKGHLGLPPPSALQKPDPISLLQEGISLLFSRWNGLQLAVRNKWGGHDSLQKSHQLAADILSWFSQSTGPVHVEDVENFLHESLLLCFNTDIEDGSIEVVAEQLMMMHEEYLNRSY